MAIACLTTIVVVISVTPLFVFPLVTIIALQLWTSRGYIEVSRDLRRIESNLRSPIIASFSELVSVFRFLCVLRRKTHDSLPNFY